MGIKISAIEYYLPAKTLSNEYLVETFGFDPAFIQAKLGISERRQAETQESCHTMAHEAATKLIHNQKIAPDSIDLLIVVTQNPDYRLPNVAPLLQTSLGLRNDLAGLDISLGCSGFVYALAVAKGLMTTCGFQHALIITSDPYSKIIAPNDRTTVTLFGDAAAAVLLEAHEAEQVGEFDFGTDGSGAGALMVGTGGSKNPRPSANEQDNFLFMDGRAIYTFMMKRVPLSVDRVLKSNGLTMAEVDFFVFHQASKYMLDSLRERMKIPQEKMVYEMNFCGNTVSSSIPIALRSLLADSENTGKCAVLSGFGVGLSWASVIIRL